MHLLELGSILKDRIEILNGTLRALVELSNVSLRTLKSIESGISNPKIQTLRSLRQIVYKVKGCSLYRTLAKLTEVLSVAFPFL